MTEDLPRQRVKLPETEARALATALRNNKDIAPCTLSVFAMVTKKGCPALQVQVDYPLGVDGDFERYEIMYKADNPTAMLAKNAVKRIRHRFALKNHE